MRISSSTLRPSGNFQNDIALNDCWCIMVCGLSAFSFFFRFTWGFLSGFPPVEQTSSVGWLWSVPMRVCDWGICRVYSCLLFVNCWDRIQHYNHRWQRKWTEQFIQQFKYVTYYCQNQTSIFTLPCKYLTFKVLFQGSTHGIEAKTCPAQSIRFHSWMAALTSLYHQMPLSASNWRLDHKNQASVMIFKNKHLCISGFQMEILYK